MIRRSSLLWPLAVGALSLAITAWLWNHEQQNQHRNLRDNFDFALRQAAVRVEQRMTSYEQMLRGMRGLYEASDDVTRADFAAYADALMAGADFAGLRALGWAPLVRSDGGDAAPITYVAPAIGPNRGMVGDDPFADPLRRAAMLRARDSGSVAITGRIAPASAAPSPDDSSFLMFMPLYRKGAPLDDVPARQAHVTGWLCAVFRVGELMSSLYGEGTPGLEVRIHDGVVLSDATLIYASVADPDAARRVRLEAQEYIAFAGHTWTLSARSSAQFENRFSNDSAQIIAIAGGGLSLVLALLAWQLVTGRERAHAAATAMTRKLRESAQRYRRIVETANEGIWTVDARERITFANPKMEEMLGYRVEELIGRSWADFIGDGAVVPADGGEPLHRGRGTQREIRFRRKNGTDLWATLSTSPIRDENGVVAGALGMVTDVTERKHAEANRAMLEGQLRQSQKMEAIGTLAGGIAHDFNNILAAILGNVNLAREELAHDHPALVRLEQIARAGTRARSLVHQIVAFSRQQPTERVNQPLRPLLEETVKLLRSTLPALVELDLRLSDAALQVGADATQLQQVLMNLCTNAWHALQGRAGRIVIGLEPTTLDAEAAERLGGLVPGPYAHLWVRDNGCGMDGATRRRAFEPFFTTKPIGQGTGLGLAVVHGIVVAHGGAITVDSAPGEGSSFDIVLPLVREGTRPDLPAEEAGAPPGQGQHVLYVDDDAVMLLMVEALLQRAAYRVTCIGDPRQALARLREGPADIDVLVTDFNMPELSGLVLAQEAMALRPGLPVVVTSGYVSDALRAEAARIGVRQVLQKEFTLEQLAGMLHRVLAQRAALPQAARSGA